MGSCGKVRGVTGQLLCDNGTCDLVEGRKEKGRGGGRQD